MRVNVYAEEMTDRMEIIEKKIDGHTFTALRLYLELPVTTYANSPHEPRQISGPFMHRPGDDDSAAVTFWGKRDLRVMLRKALAMLDEHYEGKSEGDPCNIHKKPDGRWGCLECDTSWSAAHFPDKPPCEKTKPYTQKQVAEARRMNRLIEDKT